MTRPTGHRYALIDFLEKAAQKEDRAVFAALRRGLGKEPGTVAALYPYVAPLVPEQAQLVDRDGPYYLVASLFALHPSSEGGTNLGDTLRRVAGRPGDERNPSTEKRFRALLGAHSNELPGHLRHAVSLAASPKRAVPVDWDQLLYDLLHWSHPSRFVQRAWARSFWSGARADEPEAQDPPAPEPDNS